MSTDIIIPTPLKVFTDIELVAMSVLGLSQQMEWHVGMAQIAARQYDGELRLYGLCDLLTSLVKQLGQTYENLQGLAELAGKLGVNQVTATS